MIQESGSDLKARKIAEILGMLSEGRRGKDWLLKEIRKYGLKHPLRSALNSYEILNDCSSDFIDKLYGALKGEHVPGFEDAQSLTMTYHWLFTDIVGGSNPTISTKDQARNITVLNELMARTETFRKRDHSSTVILPVGDGVAIGFGDSPEKPILLAIELHKALYRYNESKNEKGQVRIRIGLDMGPVYFVRDLNGKDNVWGQGIILTRRVMDLCGPMNIFASARIADDLRKLSHEYEKILRPIGNYSIKHGEELSIYNVYGNGFGNKIFPKKDKIAAPDLERDLRTSNNFSFDEVSINLKILDSKTMLTRHSLVWKMVNNSKTAMTQIFYVIDGDVPKEFGDMNIIAKDDYDNTLEILSVNVNKPYHKEFNVQLNKPLKPKQKKTVILQYDWEEPKRNHFNSFSSGCKRFSISLIANEDVQLEPRMLKVDTETGSKTDASPPPVVTNENHKTVVKWSTTELMADDAYQFNW